MLVTLAHSVRLRCWSSIEQMQKEGVTQKAENKKDSAMPGHYEAHYICKNCGKRFALMNNKTKGERDFCPNCNNGKMKPLYEASKSNWSLFFFTKFSFLLEINDFLSVFALPQCSNLCWWFAFSSIVPRHKTEGRIEVKWICTQRQSLHHTSSNDYSIIELIDGFDCERVWIKKKKLELNAFFWNSLSFPPIDRFVSVKECKKGLQTVVYFDVQKRRGRNKRKLMMKHIFHLSDRHNLEWEKRVKTFDWLCREWA